MTPPTPSIAVVGAGSVGMNLLRHCARQHVAVAAVVEKDPSRLDRARGLHPDAALSAELPARLPDAVSRCVIAVPDAAIADIGRCLAASTALPSGLIVFHCSGTLDSSVLSPLADSGCLIGSIHPMMSFHNDSLPASALRGIGCGIEGDDAFWIEGQRFAELMDWRPLRIDTKRKSLYHAANVFAGNFPTVLAFIADALLRAAAADASAAELSYLLPMMHAVLARLDDTTPGAALTGPAARGDLETIRRHLDALKEQDAEFRDVYNALTRAALTLRQR